jgi:putative endonuclease
VSRKRGWSSGIPFAKLMFMKWVYYLQSTTNPEQTYVGITSDLDKRLRDHNWGRSPKTREYRPWKIIVAFEIHDDSKAREFDKYLKSGPGRAFLNRHFK